jgi:acetyl esterase/lipase
MGAFMKQGFRVAGLFAISIISILVWSCSRAGDIESDRSIGLGDGDRYAWMHRVAVNRDLPYGDDPQQRLDLYLQGTFTGEPTFFERANDVRPTLLFIHGGGWVVRDRRPEPWVYPFVEQGWHVVSMTYRLGPGTAPLAVDDAVCALDWIAQNAGQYGFDLDRVVVAGVSAGGHLALMAGILGSRPGHACYPGPGFRVHSIVNWFGITDIEAVEGFLAAANPVFGNYALAWIGDTARVAQISAAYSPVNVVDQQTPPVLTIHGTDDAVVPFDQAVVLHEKLDALGIRNELLSLEGGIHAGFTDAQFSQAFAAMLEFVETSLQVIGPNERTDRPSTPGVGAATG